jgi:arsenite/tail-anchored protein-transporting ATPase
LLRRHEPVLTQARQMRFLDAPPRFLFFTGKGGVGKTSLASATAVWLARRNKRVLLVSTDPASNLGQVFGVSIGSTRMPLPAVPGLFALNIDPQAAAQGYRDRIVGPVRGVLPEAVVKGIEEQLSGACTTEVAAFDEFTGLLTDRDPTNDFDHIVFDTAPTGHTIRLLQLPSAWTGFLEAGKGDASCLGPLAGLDKQRARYKAAVDALMDAGRTRVVLVARAQPVTLREAARTHEELAAIGLTEQFLVINGVLPGGAGADDELASALSRQEREAMTRMPEALRALPRDEVSLRPFNLVGIEALASLIDATEGAPRTDPGGSWAPETRPLKALIDQIAADGHGLVMLMGKGGVGKTTVAAAIALDLAERGLPVHLTTSDPAAHLSETLAGTLPNLEVSRIDPQVETERYRAHVLETKGKALDAPGRALLEEDLRSPCIEEVAVFHAFSRVIRDARRKFVVMDTAPTGHTLLLLDATGAYYREVTRQSAGEGTRYVTPMMQLQDPKRTKILIVTLPETTPVLEAAALQVELRRAGIEPWAWVINQSLASACTRSPLLRKRALNERGPIEDVINEYTARYAVIAVQAEEPVGIGRLRSLTRLETLISAPE